MSQENVEIVRRVAEVWNEGGWAAVDRAGLLHPEVEYHDDPKWPEARSAVGIPALIERFDEVLDALGRESKVEMEEVMDLGERLVAIFRFRGEARASGIHHDYRWGYVYRVRARQIDYIQAYLDPDAAVEAARIREL